MISAFIAVGSVFALLLMSFGVVVSGLFAVVCFGDEVLNGPTLKGTAWFLLGLALAAVFIIGGLYVAHAGLDYFLEF